MLERGHWQVGGTWASGDLGGRVLAVAGAWAMLLGMPTAWPWVWFCFCGSGRQVH